MKEGDGGAGPDPLTGDGQEVDNIGTSTVQADKTSVDLETITGVFPDLYYDGDSIPALKSGATPGLPPVTGSDSIRPWIDRRETILTDRTAKNLQLQPETEQAEDETIADLSDRLPRDVNTYDFREAAYLVGLSHQDEVLEVLEYWGYNFD